MRTSGADDTVFDLTDDEVFDLYGRTPAQRKAERTRLEAIERAANARAEARAHMAAKQAVGREYWVRLDRNTTQRGVIATAKFLRFRKRRASAIAVFEITLEGGSQRFEVETLPR